MEVPGTFKKGMPVLALRMNHPTHVASMMLKHHPTPAG